jgi:hypothetical protein
MVRLQVKNDVDKSATDDQASITPAGSLERVGRTTPENESSWNRHVLDQKAGIEASVDLVSIWCRLAGPIKRLPRDFPSRPAGDLVSWSCG